jgi:acyl-CoA synthetase (AMP-forming)/AMP-acid ligase II
MIIRGGVKIYPAEVEALLLAHPPIADAAVVGLPDPSAGERVAAFLVATDGAAIVPADVRHWVATGLAAHAAPREIRIVDELPRVPTGKVDKTDLRARLLEERNHHDDQGGADGR